MNLFEHLRSALFTTITLFLLNTFISCDPEKTVIVPETTKVLSSYEDTS